MESDDGPFRICDAGGGMVDNPPRHTTLVSAMDRAIGVSKYVRISELTVPSVGHIFAFRSLDSASPAASLDRQLRLRHMHMLALGIVRAIQY